MPTVEEAVKRFEGVKGRVAVAIWQEEDVLERAERLEVKITREEAGEILDQIDRKQDCELGINWTTLDIFIQDYRPRIQEAPVSRTGGGTARVRRCDSRCHNAKKPRCRCWCGGHFHGAQGAGNREALVQNEAEQALLLQQHGFRQGETKYIHQLELRGVNNADKMERAKG